jgi:peptide/nickel transport system substrate-binding protein
MNNGKNILWALVIIAVVLAAILPSCAPQRNNNMEVRYGFTTEPTTLDPLNPANTADGRSILFNIFEGLVKPNADGLLMPCIAESWTIENEGQVYNFVIREGILFHDGAVLTVEDIMFSLDTAISA